MKLAENAVSVSADRIGRCGKAGAPGNAFYRYTGAGGNNQQYAVFAKA